MAMQSFSRASALRDCLTESEAISSGACVVLHGYNSQLNVLIKSVEQVADRAQVDRALSTLLPCIICLCFYPISAASSMKRIFVLRRIYLYRCHCTSQNVSHLLHAYIWTDWDFHKVLGVYTQLEIVLSLLHTRYAILALWASVLCLVAWDSTHAEVALAFERPMPKPILTVRVHQQYDTASIWAWCSPFTAYTAPRLRRFNSFRCSTPLTACRTNCLFQSRSWLLLRRELTQRWSKQASYCNI